MGDTNAIFTASETAFLAGGGEMGTRIRSHDWRATPLGSPEMWPQSLRSAISILLPSKAQICLFWGPDLITIYNNAYAPAFGAKHPWALGRPARECWSEVWHVIKPLFEGVVKTGEAFSAKEHPFFLERQGFVEETYYDVSYDPVRIEDGSVGGIFCIVNDQTGRVLGERRLRALRDLGAMTADAKSGDDVCRQAAAALARDSADVPFSVLYLFHDLGRRARIVAQSGLELEHLVFGTEVETGDVESLTAAHAGRVAEAQARRFVSRMPDAAGDRVLVLPISSGTQSVGALVCGTSRFLRLADDYRRFFDLAVARVSSAMTNARAHEEERRRAESLAEIDRAQTAFFSNVSHEFRTPLTLMLAPIEDGLADAQNALPAAQRERLELIRRNGLRLQKLVNTLLDFSRIEAGRVQVSYEPTDLTSLTMELASVFRAAISRAGLRFVVDCPSLPETVYVDREMWEKIVFNLLSNALKFTFDGEINLALTHDGRTVTLRVRDTGTGIPADELPHVFERFHRVEGARGRSAEGSGIGLALVQELARLHGGSTHVESALHRGSTFTVTIPFGSAHLPAERIGAPRTLRSTALRSDTYLEEALRWLPDVATEQDTDRILIAASPARVSGPRAHVLLADDNADMRDYLNRLLSPRYDVRVVGDGLAALESARERRPDLVLADVMMPRLDGFALVAALRADKDLKTVPVIMLSARAGEEARVEGIQAGADDYLVKPFSARELLARVSSHLELAHIRREIAGKERAALAAIQASEEERRRIARELHDELGQQLTALALGLKAARDTVPGDSPLAHSLQRLQVMATDVGREVHRVALELRPAVLDEMGLRPALSTYIEDWSRRYDVRADFQGVQVDGPRMPSHVETTIYRVVQEALTNVARHASATAVSVVLQRHRDEVVAIVEDNGCGFDAPAAAASSDTGHLGLTGMKERVALVGGVFSVESQTGGTTVFVRIPLEPSVEPSHV